MLILVRRKDERIIFRYEDKEGNNCYMAMKLLSVETPNRIKVGIEAGSNVSIVREELLSEEEVDEMNNYLYNVLGLGS